MKNIKIGIQVSVIALIVIFAAFFSYSVTSCKKEEPAKSDKKEILSFILSEQTDSALIDKQNKKVTITVKYSANLAKLKPTITISEKATISPASGDTVDFSASPVTYVVTAEDKTTQEWEVYVTKATEMEKKILTFTLSQQSAPAVIDDINDSVNITVNSDADITKLAPVITVSGGTTINPASNSEVDFSKGAVKFTISATDGSTKDYYVKVTRIKYTENMIIAFTAPGQVSSTISGTKCTIIMPAGTNLTSVAPVLTLSPGATVTPASGQAVDFSSGLVTYTVTSEDGVAKTWTIYMTLPLIAANNSNIKYVGRIDFSNTAVPKFSAPGVYFKAKFTGTFCDIDIKDEWNMNYIAVIVDGASPVRYALTSSRKTYRVASGLTAGEHDILVCKETEAGVSAISFYGFRCQGLSAVTDMPTRKIECYGNSITCGAKMLFGTPCTLTNNNKNWNAANSAYLSYGAVAARALNAQWQISAVSGIGLIQSCCGMTNKMPDTYDRLDFNNSTSAKWDFTKYVPDVVTICLGQNDGSSNVASKTFKDAYVAFINTIRGKYSDASIFCVTSPMADSSSSSTCLFKVMQTSLASIVDSVNSAGDSKVYWVKLPHDQNHGCTTQGHPSEAEHLTTAGVLEKAIKDVMGW